MEMVSLSVFARYSRVCLSYQFTRKSGIEMAFLSFCVTVRCFHGNFDSTPIEAHVIFIIYQSLSFKSFTLHVSTGELQ